ncbi:MAG: GNAT family N-acetyltransferase [Nitrospirota bacterium]
MKKPIIKKLEWDSNFFGFNIAHLNSEGLTIDASDVEDFVKLNSINLVQTSCAISNIETITFLEKNGFHFADLMVTLILELNTAKFERMEFFMANDGDVPILKKIAKSIALYSRYYNDIFGKDMAERLYEVWLEKSIRGEFDDACLKAVKNKLPTGFVTVKFLDFRCAKIGLLGVDELHRSKGIGKKLMNSLFSFLQTKGVEKIEVVTQGKNTQALNFYINNGFRIKSIAGWYYKIFDNNK